MAERTRRTLGVILAASALVVLAIVAAALGMGSVRLLGVASGPVVGDVLLNEVLGYAGLAAASILTLRLIAGIARDGTG